MIIESQHHYGREPVNRIKQTVDPTTDGARALLETFYYAFNRRDIEVFSGVWANEELIQLNNLLGGILRGYAPIAALYRRRITQSDGGKTKALVLEHCVKSTAFDFDEVFQETEL